MNSKLVTEVRNYAHSLGICLLVKGTKKHKTKEVYIDEIIGKVDSAKLRSDWLEIVDKGLSIWKQPNLHISDKYTTTRLRKTARKMGINPAHRTRDMLISGIRLREPKEEEGKYEK